MEFMLSQTDALAANIAAILACPCVHDNLDSTVLYAYMYNQQQTGFIHFRISEYTL